MTTDQRYTFANESHTLGCLLTSVLNETMPYAGYAVDRDCNRLDVTVGVDGDAETARSRAAAALLSAAATLQHQLIELHSRLQIDSAQILGPPE